MNDTDNKSPAESGNLVPTDGEDRSPAADSGEDRGLKQIVSEAFDELGKTAAAFVRAPRALWGINIPYVIEGLVYFGILTILGKYCSENVQLTDPQAGWVYSAVTGGITLAMLFLGGVSDKIGVRKALIVSFGMFLLGRFLIAFSGTIPLGHGIASPMFLIMALGLLIMVVAYGLFQPAAYAGVKRYTNPQTAAMGYAVIYGLMNLGAFFSGFISPLVRHHFKTIFPPNGLTAVFWTYDLLILAALLITVLILTPRTDAEAVRSVAEQTERMKLEKGESEDADPQDDDAPGEEATATPRVNNLPFAVLLLLSVAVLVWSLIARSHGEIFRAVLGFVLTVALAGLTTWEFLRRRPDHPFRDGRFTFFIFILIPVQTLFAHNWLTLPYYLDRAFRGGVVSKYFEFFSNLNPIIIFVLAPIVAGLTARASIYRMMILGTLVMAVPTFLLAIGPSVPLFLTYVLLMSVGEAMWQPRFLQWISEIAPPGKTGAYMGIGQFPWFLTKMITGFYSGYFVAKYLPKPETGLPVHSQPMWLIYGLIAMVSPVALILARRWMVGGMKQMHQS